MKIPVPDQSVLIFHCLDQHPLKQVRFVQLWLQTLMQSFLIKSGEKPSPSKKQESAAVESEIRKCFWKVNLILSFVLTFFFSLLSVLQKPLLRYTFLILGEQLPFVLVIPQESWRWIYKNSIKYLILVYSFSTLERPAVQYAPHMHTGPVHFLKHKICFVSLS